MRMSCGVAWSAVTTLTPSHVVFGSARRLTLQQLSIACDLRWRATPHNGVGRSARPTRCCLRAWNEPRDLPRPHGFLPCDPSVTDRRSARPAVALLLVVAKALAPHGRRRCRDHADGGAAGPECRARAAISRPGRGVDVGPVGGVS